MHSIDSWTVMAFLMVHLGAFASACGTRVYAGSRGERPLQLVFVVTLAAVGFATWSCRTESLGLGLPSGMTLIGTVLVAVADFRRPSEVARSALG